MVPVEDDISQMLNVWCKLPTKLGSLGDKYKEIYIIPKDPITFSDDDWGV